jgi:hypothetical protein
LKNLIIINGTMGVGKSTTCLELQKILPQNVFLDGDWCWYMRPFEVSDETKAMVVDNIAYLLNNFIKCSQYKNIIFCWVMHEQSIIDDIISRLSAADYSIKIFSLLADEAALKERLCKDISDGVREYDVLQRSIERSHKYNDLDTEKIDVSNISAKHAAQLIKARLC